MDWEIQTLSRKVNNERRKPDIHPSVEEHVRELLDEIFLDLEQVRGEYGFENFLVGYIQEQAESFKDPDGDREEPLCECENSECPLKEGRLPFAVQRSEDLERGILTYRQEHATPVVIEDAQEEWREKKARIQRQLSEALVALQRNQVPQDQADEPAKGEKARP